MFETLLASTAPRQSRAGQLLTAVVVHAGIVVCAVTATESLSSASPAASPATSVLFVPPPPPAAPLAEPRAPTAPVLPAAPALTPSSIRVNPEIPPVFSVSPALPSDWIQAMTAGDTGPGETTVLDTASGSGRGPFEARETDQPPVPLKLAAPRYPPALADARIAGRVLAEFVVDTAGRVEPASIVILKSAHRGFTASVREALEGAIFRAGSFRGAPVRVLVRQAFVFQWESGPAASRTER